MLVMQPCLTAAPTKVETTDLAIDIDIHRSCGLKPKS